ncbi:MAG TPA: GGDEF domain-containing protein [Burkholderiaceae bacterium]|nr:GGDEF domain-containing protein [Burkholderiaceae bacterium]
MPTPELFDLLAVGTLAQPASHALESSAHGAFTLRAVDDMAQAREQLAERSCDVLLLDAAAAGDVPGWVDELAASTAILIVTAQAGDAAEAIGWWRRGVQDVITPELLGTADLAPRLRAAVERKRNERARRDAQATAYATDLDTGLPHRQQLIEHMSQLIALREREPAPMALLVLRVEGLATTQARLGREAAGVLRRKLAVRLRAGLRASDVVASLGDDSFAVLLGALLAPADAPRVGAKLQQALLAPFKVAGQDIGVAVALGIAQHPQDGAQPEALLQRAAGLAASAPAQGRAGFANYVEAGGVAPAAANDE